MFNNKKFKINKSLKVFFSFKMNIIYITLILFIPSIILCSFICLDLSSMPFYLKGLRANIFIIMTYRILSSPIPIQFQINFDSISIPIRFQYIPDSFFQLFHYSNKDLAHSPNDPIQLFIQRIKILNIKCQILMDIMFFCAIVYVLVQICRCQFVFGEEKVEILITTLWICIAICWIFFLTYTLNI